MKHTRPGSLAVRSVNEYRRRDTLAYLGLRYYLENEAARSDRWARDVAMELLLARTELPYFPTYHFKERSTQSGVEHRNIYLPCPNEALAEAALLQECARRPSGFGNPPAVFSYALNADENRSGIFRHYIHGLRDRHKHIAKACEECPSGVVQYADIKRFYPSIGKELATKAWHRQAELAGLPKRFRNVGTKLIDDHASALKNENVDVLTGPMFSHVLGNLVLRILDEDLSASLSVKYFRYVDDITLVGELDAVRGSLRILQNKLQDLGFELHDENSPKSIVVSTSDWLRGRDDFSDSRSQASWQWMIASLKEFLLLKPEQGPALQTAFRSESIRIPVRDYSTVVYERGFLERVKYLARRYRRARKTQNLTVNSFVRRAVSLRKQYEVEFNELLNGASDLSGYDRKRRIPQLRWRAGRLTYLAEDTSLARLASSAGEFPELYFYSCVMKAVATGEIDDLLLLGTNAAQAAAQPMRAAGKACLITEATNTPVKQQGLAIVLLNGVVVTQTNRSPEQQSEIVTFATSGSNSALMRSADPFIREIACLHGLSKGPRHEEVIRAVFDEDEELAMDAIEQMQPSASP